MEENRDGHAIVSNVIKSLEKGGFFSPSDREKFAQTAREHGIEGSVIEEVIDIAQTISLIHRHKSIDENLEALKSIRNAILVRDRLLPLPFQCLSFTIQEILKNIK
ncbi:hypothetical protein [Helicobacter pylori]